MGIMKLLGVVALMGSLVGCSGGSEPPAAPAAATTRSTTTTTPATTTPAPTTVRLGDAPLRCFNTNDKTTLTIRVPRDTADFTSVWGVANGGRCEGDDIYPVTDLEKEAHAVSGYEVRDVSTLYGICASVRPDDVYLQEGFAMNGGQAAEVRGALTLCPNHPLAAEYAAAIEASGVAQEQAARGERVGPGTHRVPEEMQRGTFVAKDVTDCYWETRDANGEIVDNDFVLAAPQARVTVGESAVVFTSERCGTWVKEG